MKHRRLLATATGVAAGALALAAATIILPTATGAATVTGAIGIKSAGGTYAGLAESNPSVFMSEVTRAVAPGKTGKYSVEVLNTGDTSTQYRLFMVTFASTPTTAHLLLGKTDLTSQALVSPGAQIPSLAPGKSTKLTLELTAPSAPDPTYYGFAEIVLNSSDGTSHYSQTAAELSITGKTGTTDHDLFVKTGGQAEVAGSGHSSISSKTIKVGQKATFSVQLKNDSAATGPITLTLTHTNCGNFTEAATVGKLDVTAAAFGSGYTSAPLASGKSVTVTLTVTNTGAWPTSCNSGNVDYVSAQTTGSTAEQIAALLLTDSV